MSVSTTAGRTSMFCPLVFSSFAHPFRAVGRVLATAPHPDERLVFQIYRLPAQGGDEVRDLSLILRREIHELTPYFLSLH